ncbi:hypothetical protein EVAR_93757_1 [Eumeta japonica]|uniref:Uncharacterized protein n=1 Tax=Eumeta variegata TaxID=151549 RepID=A0A4C2AHL9_EUMVA|nr:hypothetical protein EVAR_93757_1 [Eumeta japonica]
MTSVLPDGSEFRFIKECFLFSKPHFIHCKERSDTPLHSASSESSPDPQSQPPSQRHAGMHQCECARSELIRPHSARLASSSVPSRQSTNTNGGRRTRRALERFCRFDSHYLLCRRKPICSVCSGWCRKSGHRDRAAFTVKVRFCRFGNVLRYSDTWRRTDQGPLGEESSSDRQGSPSPSHLNCSSMQRLMQQSGTGK